MVPRASSSFPTGERSTHHAIPTITAVEASTYQYTDASESRVAMPGSGCTGGIPYMPSVPPVSERHSPAAVTVSSPSASVVIRKATPRVRIATSPVAPAKAAAPAVRPQNGRGVRADQERRGLAHRGQAREAGQDADTHRQHSEGQRLGHQPDAIAVKTRGRDKEQHRQSRSRHSDPHRTRQ
jgi:hypothetical protein